MKPGGSIHPFGTTQTIRPEILLAVITRATQGAAMLIAMLGIPQFLSEQAQGFFFVYISLGALLQLGEFGVAYATLQTASHLAAAGDSSGLMQVRHQARRLNLLLSMSSAAAVGSLGLVIFSLRPEISSVTNHWMLPWLTFITSAFVTQLINLEITFIEGSRSAPVAWAIRLSQEVVAGSVFIAALFWGAGLWSLTALWATRSIVAALLLRPATPRTGARDCHAPHKFRWRTDAWPFQWRIGLSALSGFLIFQAITPIVLVAKGAIIAGQIGMSLAMMNMLLSITTVWPLSQSSRYGRLIKTQQFERLRRDFWRVTGSSTAFAIFIAVAILLLLYLMTQLQAPLTARAADFVSTIAFLATAVIHHIVYCFAVLLRAERREPLLTASVLGGLLNVVLVWGAAHYGGSHAIALINLACAAIGIPIAAAHYVRCLSRWRAA